MTILTDNDDDDSLCWFIARRRRQFSKIVTTYRKIALSITLCVMNHVFLLTSRPLIFVIVIESFANTSYYSLVQALICDQI